jgi:hypothetical protein
MPFLLMLIACFPADPESSIFQGFVRSGSDVAGPTLGGASLTSYGPDGTMIAETTSNGDGSFEVAVPWGGLFAVVVDADGHVPTSMSGFGQTDTVLAPHGAVFARTTEWWETEQETWADCPGLADGPVVEGILRAYLPVPNDEVDTLPVINTGELALELDETSLRFPCYLTDEATYDAEAMVTGDTGRFFFADAPQGWSVLSSTFTLEGTVYGGMDHAVFVPESGVVSLDPALADTPGL